MTSTLSIHILIVDDDPDLLQFLSEALQQSMPNVVFEVASSAHAALACIQRQDYEAVVTDLTLSGLNGLDLLTEIRALRPDIPTLLITGNGDPALFQQAHRKGAYDFLRKPLDMTHLVRSLRRAIKLRQLRRQVEAISTGRN